MKELFFKGGLPVLADTAPPGLSPGRILVETHYSAVSPGTETGLLASGGRSFLSLALEKRARAGRILEALHRRDFEDIRARFQRLAGRRQEWTAPGYSLAGVVLAVGEGVSAFAPGDRVAAAGAGYAAHAQTVTVPKNLAVRVPMRVSLEAASTVALGAIALQSVRRADSRVGETVLVLGLGLLGQMTARILIAAGCRTLGWDPSAARRALAASHGVELLAAADTAGVAPAVLALTSGLGADQVILAAAAGRDAVDAAARSTRRSGRLVLLGHTPVEVDREAAYERELEIRMSTSYGPGRYDPHYEEEGADYPYAHVRWTENRNMAAWLELLASGRVRIDDLTAAVRGIDEAAEAYLEIQCGTAASLGLVFRHAAADAARPAVAAPAAAPPATSSPAAPASEPPRRAPMAAPLRVALLGTGAYAAEGILPVLARLPERARLELLVGSAPARREPLARKFNFARTGSDHAVGAADPAVDLVVIATRHHLHAELTVRALEAGHAVFCEKPLALTPEQLDRIESAWKAKPGFLAVGFNRRFAPAVQRLRAELAGRRGPLSIAYRVQAGLLPESHWIRGPEGGGRLVGEGVHMCDLVRCLTGAPLETAWVAPGGAGAAGDPAADNFQLGLRYGDGSTATILYTSRGSSQHPKERIELHWDGRTMELENFVLLRESGRGAPLYTSPAPRKGQAEMWDACLRALVQGEASPIPMAEIMETSRAVLALEQLRRGA